ncbi:very-long-chain 3-oxoacyl-CoA reductase-B-like [Dasypus novemcinctus]|uniref:very-long-chain 3-oxoacyl-CoA reductase-B-like n=1 Tax=Dasypus novemcinctus TaxID=9361 RepID=UPI00265EBAC9|nr:very-long-chain 3-oxoacyl-CoA reductase-B-like [Dasypus novemcinctus]
MQYFGNRIMKLQDAENPAKALADIVNCNVLSVAQMTRIVLPQMVARGRGVIINISSETENGPWPFLAAYAATKAFVGSFSRAVGAEYLSQGVTVQTVSPLVVSTNMTKRMKTRLLLKDPRDFAREALDNLGLSSHTSGCLSHAVQHFLLSFLLLEWFLLSQWGVKFTSLVLSLSGPKRRKEN